MNTPNDESGDELTRAYRRESDADAGSPAAATRTAILAEARAAALRRRPAANDARYAWRAVAGIAVLGVALLLWRQTARHVAPDLTVATERPAGAAGPIDVPQRVTATAPADAVREPAAPAKDARSASPKAEAAREREADAGRTDNASAAATASADSQQLAGVNAAPAAPPAAGAQRSAGIDYGQLLQREFPEVWNESEPPHTVWVVMDSRGNVLRKGSLSPGAAISADQPIESQRPWTMVKVQTASGRELQLAVMTLN
jgi:hypothetical protein